MSSITVMRPDVEAAPPGSLQMVERVRAACPGLRLTLVDNGKPKAKTILLAFADELADHLPELKVSFRHKSSASWPISSEEAEEIAASSDLALTGLGDCGGCCASSLADAVALERVGVPATVVMTEAFQGLAASYARRLGAPGFACVVLPHPVASRNDDELQVLATKFAPTALGLLVAG